ncbi:ABC transporter permease [Paractinoplanes brasiliensis]|uniref:ABC-2 type transport system permease protein n=1 Tax=Paractinoplanes brasiliensis TaxID=52695 RepID=A0A4R6JAW8_9ACTN|nr:ABC transporter permease [Actinoplanes brasiliensis]TDO32873.1 ABC-2 type transport system permease protein [Actinoplanes brasiliensis]GID31582.1 transport permease protein [Actinoplanes brasiliensis]
MSSVRALTWIELKLFLREPVTVVFTLALPPLVLFVLSEVFGDAPDPQGAVFRGVGGSTYYLPAYIGLVVASLGVIGLPVHLAAYRERGVLRRFQAARVPVRALLASQLAVLAAGVVAGAALLIGLAAVTSDIRWAASWLGVVAATALGVIMFAAIGVLLGAVMPTARAAQGIGLLLWFTMMMVCGAGPPPEVLTPALTWIGELLPLRPLVIAVQDPWLGFGFNWAQAGVLAAVGVASAVLAVPALRRRS